MAPREANSPYPDQYLTVEYDATAMILPHDAGPRVLDEDLGDDDIGVVPPAATGNDIEGNQLSGAEEASIEEDDQSTEDDDLNNIPQPTEAHLSMNNTLPLNLPNGDVLSNNNGNQPWARLSQRNINRPGITSQDQLQHHLHNASGRTLGRHVSQPEVDPIAIDMSDPEEDEAWNATHMMFVEAATATFNHNHRHIAIQPRSTSNNNNTPLFSSTSRQISSGSLNSTSRRRRSHNSSSSLRGALVSPTPENYQESHRVFGRQFHRGSLSSVLDQDPSISDDEQDDVNLSGVPDLDNTLDTSTATSDNSSAPNTPQAHITWDLSDTPQGTEALAISAPIRPNLSPVRRMRRREQFFFGQQSSNNIDIVTDEESNNSPSSFNLDEMASSSQLSDFNTPPSPPRRHNSSILSVASRIRTASNASNTSGRSIHWTSAFTSDNLSDISSAMSSSSLGNTNTQGPNQINFSFGPNTTVSDLKYFVERGCIVHLLRALDTPRLKTVGSRMLADYAKMPHRRVAVASNRRVLEFCCRTMLEMPSADDMGTEWPAREYAVETIRSLTATEDSDSFLMGCPGLLKALPVVVRGGPFYDISNAPIIDPRNPKFYRCDTSINMGLVSGKARLHACIAIMNLSCGKTNKIEIASISEVLEAMRDVMIATPEQFAPATSSQSLPNSTSSSATPKSVSEEACLKAATCIKNLSNADANDASLLGAEGLVQALAHAAVITCTEEKGATHCTTNACLALMNLSISKANKHKVFKTKGVMDGLMTVLARTSPSDKRPRSSSNNEARVKACSALSNLAIGYENKIPMFLYDGFVDAILEVIRTDTGEARTKACSILWSFAAEMKNQVPVSYFTLPIVPATSQNHIISLFNL